MARQIGSAVGVATEVVILGTPARHSMADFRHARATEIVAGALAALAASGVGRRRPASR